MADNGVSREVILWRARTVLDAPDPTTTPAAAARRSY